jgi:hypothetical protein
MDALRSIALGVALATALSQCKESPPASTVKAPTPAPTAPGPASEPAAQGATPADVQHEPPFSGNITLDPGLPKDSVRPSDVLFVMARQSVNGAPGQLLATQRYANATFPLHFEMSSKDLMVPGARFAGPFVVNARLDRDGNPMTKTPDDLYATVPGEVKGGQTNLELVLMKGDPSQAPLTTSAPPSSPASQPTR